MEKVKKAEKIDLGELKFDFANVDYDSDAEIRRQKKRKAQVILGKSNEDCWKKALLRAQGLKVKDDPKLLEKSKKRKLVIKKKSAKVWQERLKMMEEKKDKRQKRREVNINKRIEQKKQKSIKRRSRR